MDLGDVEALVLECVLGIVDFLDHDAAHVAHAAGDQGMGPVKAIARFAQEHVDASLDGVLELGIAIADDPAQVDQGLAIAHGRVVLITKPHLLVAVKVLQVPGGDDLGLAHDQHVAEALGRKVGM